MRRGSRTPRLAAALAASACALAATAVTAAAAPQPYGTNDAGGFRNVLPPGEAGTDTVAQLAQFQLNGQRPPHFDDQQSLYQNLLYASPTLTHDQIASFYKDATFGVKAGEEESTITPRPGTTIVRDKAYGTPHVYGDTRGDTMFGAGYAAAQDRLFLIDILRHTGRAELSSFIGGSPSNRAMDRTQWEIAPYTEKDLQSQIDNAPKLYGAEGEQVIADVTDFVAGMNQYVSEATLDPSKLPAEYVALGKMPQPFTLTDVIAEASLVGGIFGKGGGEELRSALTMHAFERQFGQSKGRRAWKDFRQKDDPEAPTTVKQRFPYETDVGSFAKPGLALPDPGSVEFTPPAPPVESSGASAKAKGRFSDVGRQLMKALTGPPHASNWELVSAANSATGHPIAVMGPQVGYYIPQILMEEDLHGPGIDAEGASFPGVNLYVQLGHGRDYAWSATSAGSDLVDTFAEVLCEDDFHYLYKGECRPMDKLERENSWTPSAVDMTPPGSETLTAYRTVHGVVYARGTVGGKKVAFARARTTYFHEADSALGFSRLNNPGFVHDAASFQRAADGISFTFNWAYVDSDDIAYYQSGAYPQRAPGTSPDFPVLGTGEYDWQSFDPTLHTMATLPFEAHPQAINPPYLVSWNNKQAPGWAAADDQYGYGPLYRSQMIEAFVKRGIADGKKMRLEQLVQAMEEPATQDIRAVKVLPVLLPLLEGHYKNKAKAKKKKKRHHSHRRRHRSRRHGQRGPRFTGKLAAPSPRLQAAIDLLKGWSASGGHRRDLDKNGHYDDDEAVTLMDAWWPKLLAAQFQPALGDEAFGALGDMIQQGDPIGGSPDAPAFSQGWWGYVHKDLRDTFRTSKPKGAWSRQYCGGGSRDRCVRRLRASLLAALDPDKKALYGHGDCEQDAQASCFDMNRFTVTSAVDVPDFPFQNRPTFQQAIELTRRLPR